MRFVTDNAADRATVTVANTAIGLGAENLLTDTKGQVCRILGNVATITVTWPTLETVGAVVIPASNLGASTTIQVKAYSDELGTNLLYDTGTKWAAPGAIFENEDFTQPLNVNSFAFGFPPLTQVYFEQQQAVKRVEVFLAGQEEGFIDISRLVIGPYFEPSVSAAYGQDDGIIDLSVNTRAASGDIKTENGPMAKRMTLTLDAVSTEDRAKVLRILQRGVGKWLFVSICPQDIDAEKERDKSIYGKLSTPGSMNWNYYANHTSVFEIEGF